MDSAYSTKLCGRLHSPVSTKHILRAQLDPSAERAEAEPSDVATVVSAETTDALEIGLLARIEPVVPVPLRLLNLFEAARWQLPFAQHSLGALFMHERQMVEAEMDDAPGVASLSLEAISALNCGAAL